MEQDYWNISNTFSAINGDVTHRWIYCCRDCDWNEKYSRKLSVTISNRIVDIVNNRWMSIGVSCQQTSSGVAEGKAAFPNNSNNTGIAWSSVVVRGENVNKQNLNSIAATCTIRDLHAFASSQLSINRLKLIIWFTRKKSESIGLWLNHQFDCRKIEKFLLS